MKADLSQFIRTIEFKDRSGRVIGTKEVVTYQGLLSKAHDEGLKSVRTSLLQIPSEDNSRTAIAKAEVETEKGRFEAIGDASPESVTSFLEPHLIRMAETRAKARALRDAVNIGVVSFEELDGEELNAQEAGLGSGVVNGNAMSENQRRFLFRLLASQGLVQEEAHHHLLDHFGVPSLADVSKEQASSFIDDLQSRPRGNGADAHRGAPVQR